MTHKPTTLKVLTLPDARLRSPAVPVTRTALTGLRRSGFLDALVATMHAEDGVGIAATQVGSPLRIFVALEGRTPRVYVNPELTSRSLRTAIDTEGCLSVPGLIGTVKRHRSVTLRAWDMDGQPVVRKAKDLVARIYQHEIDHLDGVLFVDRAITTMEIDASLEAPRV